MADDNLNDALNRVLDILKREPDYATRLRVRVNFYLGPELITISRHDGEEAVLGEQEIIGVVDGTAGEDRLRHQ